VFVLQSFRSAQYRLVYVTKSDVISGIARTDLALIGNHLINCLIKRMS